MRTAGSPEAKKSHNGRDATDASSQGPSARQALADALDHYRAGQVDLHEAAEEAGVASWDLLEAIQATPDPMVLDADENHSRPPTFVRPRND